MVFEYGYLMLNFQSNEIKRIQSKIDKNDLYINEKEGYFGLENETHISLLPSITEEIPLKYILKKLDYQYPLNDIKFLLGKISFFENELFDVMKYEVISPIIEEINFLLSKSIKTEVKYKFNPHATICYLKKGRIKNYEGLKYKGDILKYPTEWMLSHPNGVIEKSKDLVGKSKRFIPECMENWFYDEFLYEGLIKTQDINQTISIIKREFCENITDIRTVGKYNSVIDITFKDKTNVNNILVRMNNLGWTPSGKDYKKLIQQSNNNDFTLEFEAKFDREIQDKEKEQIFYHVTPTVNYINKINKIGLCPKTQNKKAEHPERVYLFPANEYNNSVKTFASNILNNAFRKNIEYQKEVSILEIKLDIETFLKLKLFKDSYSSGYWTYQNIPPKNIREIKRLTINPKTGIFQEIGK